MRFIFYPFIFIIEYSYYNLMNKVKKYEFYLILFLLNKINLEI